MSGRGASKKDDGQIDSSKGKDKATAPETKVDAVPKPAAAGAASDSTGKLKNPGEKKPSGESKPSDGLKQPGGAKHSGGDKLSGEAKALGGSVHHGDPKQLGEPKPTGGSIPSSDRKPAEEAKRPAGTTRIGAPNPSAEPKVTADTSGGTKALGEPKHSRDLKPSRQPKVSEPTKSEPDEPGESKLISDSKFAGQPKPLVESKSPGKPTAELKSDRDPKLSGTKDKKPIGEPKISSESKSTKESKPPSEPKSRGITDRAKDSDKKKVERGDEHADKEKKTLKEEAKGDSSKMDSTSAVPKTGATKERASPTSKKVADQAKTKAEIAAAAKDSDGKVDAAKKGAATQPAPKTDGKAPEKPLLTKGADLKLKETKVDDGASSSTVISTALKKDAKKDQSGTAHSPGTKASVKKDEKKDIKATEHAQRSVPVSDKKESTIKRSPEKSADRPKESADKVSPKGTKVIADGVPKSKLNSNGKESGRPSSVSKSPTQESLKKSPKDEKPKAAVSPAPEKKSPSASTSPKQKKTQPEPTVKDSVLKVNGKESSRPSSISKSPTQESLKKSPKDEKPKPATSQAPEKKSPSLSTIPKQNKSQAELLGKDSDLKDSRPEAAKPQIVAAEKKEEAKEAKAKPIPSPTAEKQDIKIPPPQQNVVNKKPEFPKLAIMDKIDPAKLSETKKSPSSLGDRSLTQEAASKAAKGITSPRTPEVKVVEFVSPDTQRKSSTSEMQSPIGDEPDSAKRGSQGTKSPLADSALSDSKVLSTLPLKDFKKEPNSDPQKLGARETTLKGSSVGTLPTSAKATEEEKSTSVSEPRLNKDAAAKTSKPERSNGADSSKAPILHPNRRPSIPDSRDPKLSPRLTPQFSPASDGQKRFQFPPDPSKTIQSPSSKESPVQARSPASPLDRSDSSCESSLGRRPSATRKTPGEHKTIVQMLQEAREEALPRGERKAPDLKEYSKSEMMLPGTPSNGSRREPSQQMTSSPNLKAQNGVTFRIEDVKKGVPGKIDIKPTDAKGISKSEVVLPAAATPDAKTLPEIEKQMTSSPNLSSVRGRHVSSVEGLPEADSIARSSPSVAVLNGMHRPQRGGERRDSRKGSIISDTGGMPEQGGGRARSATWSQTVMPKSAAAKREEETTASTDAEWDKRWSSAGSDLLAEKALGTVPSKKGSINTVPIGTGKEWRSEGIAKAVSTPFNGVTPKVGSSEHIRKTTEVSRGSEDKRAWESEAGLVRHASSKGYTKFDNPSETKPSKNGSDLKRDIKDLVSPSSSTASKGSGIEKVSEASGSYHSVASSTHRRDSKSEAVPRDVTKHVAGVKPPETIESGDKVKLIEQEKGEELMKERSRQGFDVEIIVEMGWRERKGSRGSGKRSGRSREQHGVENQGADLERALQEEEEAAGTSSGRGQGAKLRPYIDLWESEDKFSVANSQLPLNPTGEEDAGSVGSMLTTEPERGNWTGRFDFILSLLGYSVGLGNVWRFPYLCYNNGGGAFLIPFTIMLVIAGLPLMFMELSFGQYANLGPAAIYAKFCPLFHGLGYGMVIVSTVVMLYYNLIIAWTIFYMFASLNKQLPWSNCEPEWSTLDCYSYEIADDCMERNGTYYQRTCYNETEAAANNITHLAEKSEKRPPAEEYFNNYVLGLSKGIEETGEIRLSMALCLLLAWAIVFLCLSKGVQSSGKVVYFTALFPYVVLIMLFIRGVTLPGASTGILFYLTPDWQRLANAQVWGDAAVQIFFALSPAWGGLITLASYNKFSNNCYKDSLIVAVSNILTSFFAGFVIFSVIGFLAHELNVEVKKVVDQGAGLAFIVYPEVVTRLPVSPVWSLLFFVMLLTLGLDSQFALMETVTTAILDRFPNLREKKVWVVLVVAVLGYFGGLIFTTNSGMYWLQLMDKYAANWSVLLIAISECILIAWVYGADRFLRDVQEMIGPKSRNWMFFWCWMWKLVTPATLLFILFFNWVEYTPATYGVYVYPLWADAAGWAIGVFPVLVIIGVGVVKVYSAPEATLRERFKRLLQPTPDWGPTFKRSSAPPTYDSIKNTIVLMNGLPVIQETHADGESLEDNTL